MNTSCHTISILFAILTLLVLSCMALSPATLIDGQWVCTLLITLITTMYAVIRVCVPDYEGGQSFIFVVIAFPLIMWCIYELVTTTLIDGLLHGTLSAYIVLYVIILLEMVNQCTSISKIRDIPTEP